MESKKLQTIFLEAWNHYKKHWELNLLYSLALFCFFAISIMIFLWLKMGFAITFFFFVLPLIYGLEMTVFLNIHQNGKMPLRGYFLLSLSYYQRVFRSSYKGMRNFFIMLGSFLFYLFVFSMVYCLTYAKGLEGFNATISNLENLLSNQSISFEEISDFISENGSIYPLFLYGVGGAYLFAIISFCFLFRDMITGGRFRYLFPMLDKMQYNTFSAIAFAYYKKNYREEFYKSCFPLFLILIGGYLLGFFLGNSLSNHYYASIALGFTISSFLFSLYLPFLFSCFYSVEFEKEATYWPLIRKDMENSFEAAIKSKEAKESDRVVFTKNLDNLDKEIKLYHTMIRMTPNSSKEESEK